MVAAVPASITSPARLQARKLQLVRDDISEAAMRLFAQRGFAKVTIDAIAAAVGVSRRTFFRYFATKQDVVVARIDRCGLDLGEALAARPASEPPLLAIRRALDPLLAFCCADPAHAAAVARLMRQTPALRGCLLDKQAHWQSLVAREIGCRLDGRDAALRARVVAAAALAAFDTAFLTWTADTGLDLRQLVDRAFAILAACHRAPAPGRGRRRARLRPKTT